MVFFTWRSAILKSDLGSTTKLVLLVLSTYMDDHGGGAFPNVKTIASDSGLSERAVCTHIERAVDAGFIVVSKQKLPGKNWARNAYKISFPSRPDVYQEQGADRGSVPKNAPSESKVGRGLAGSKKQGTERGASPCGGGSKSSDSSDFETKALNEVQHQNTEGTERHAEGTERDDSKALNDVQSISPVTSPKTSPIKSQQQQHASDDDDSEFAMSLDWAPEPERFAELLDLRDVSSELASQDALNEFRGYWVGRGDLFPQKLWEHKLASSLIEFDANQRRRVARNDIGMQSVFGESYARRQREGRLS